MERRLFITIQSILIVALLAIVGIIIYHKDKIIGHSNNDLEIGRRFMKGIIDVYTYSNLKSLNEDAANESSKLITELIPPAIAIALIIPFLFLFQWMLTTNVKIKIGGLPKLYFDNWKMKNQLYKIKLEENLRVRNEKLKKELEEKKNN